MFPLRGRRSRYDDIRRYIAAHKSKGKDNARAEKNR